MRRRWIILALCIVGAIAAISTSSWFETQARKIEIAKRSPPPAKSTGDKKGPQEKPPQRQATPKTTLRTVLRPKLSRVFAPTSMKIGTAMSQFIEVPQGYCALTEPKLDVIDTRLDREHSRAYFSSKTGRVHEVAIGLLTNRQCEAYYSRNRNPPRSSNFKGHDLVWGKDQQLRLIQLPDYAYIRDFPFLDRSDHVAEQTMVPPFFLSIWLRPYECLLWKTRMDENNSLFVQVKERKPDGWYITSAGGIETVDQGVKVYFRVIEPRRVSFRKYEVRQGACTTLNFAERLRP